MEKESNNNFPKPNLLGQQTPKLLSGKKNGVLAPPKTALVGVANYQKNEPVIQKSEISLPERNQSAAGPDLKEPNLPQAPPQEIKKEKKDKVFRVPKPVSFTRPKDPAQTLSSQERDRFRQNILKEISNHENPVTRTAQDLQDLIEYIPPKEYQKNTTLLTIERIMEEGLWDFYLAMEKNQQKKFKLAGENLALKVENFLNKRRVKLKKISKMMRKWLKAIPGVSRIFVIEEAEIKANQIIRIKTK